MFFLNSKVVWLTDEEPEAEADDTIVFEGQEYKIDDLVKGGLRQADYTRKTQALAEQRKGMEAAQQQYTAESQAVQAERQQYINALSQIIQSSAQGLDQFARIDWESLKEEDHIEYLSKKDEYREAQEKVQQHQFAMQQAQQKQSVESENQYRIMINQLRNEARIQVEFLAKSYSDAINSSNQDDIRFVMDVLLPSIHFPILITSKDEISAGLNLGIEASIGSDEYNSRAW